MKVIIAVLLMAAALPAFAADAAGSGDNRARSAGQRLIGQPGPAAALTTIDGERIDLVKYYGKQPVYLKFWATWCVPCREQMPAFEKAYQQHKGRIAVVAVNAGFSDKEPAVRAYREQFGIHMPVAIDDGSLAGQLNLRVTPQHVVIGRDGRIVHVGHLHDKALDDALDKVANDASAPSALPLAPTVAERKVLKPGDAVGLLSVMTVDGKTYAFKPGKPRALVFFSPWCESYLRDSRPAVAQACGRVREESTRLAKAKGVEWLGVASPIWASDKEVAEYGASKKPGMPLALDKSGEVFGAFSVRDIPSVVLIDAQGKVSRVLGPDERDLAQAVHALGVR